MQDLPVYQADGFTYVRISELPQLMQDPFRKWMSHQTCPLVEGAPDAVYSWDWERYRRMLDGKAVLWD